MRSVIFGAASALALLAPAAASAETAGYVDISVGQADIDSTDLDMISLGGAVVTPVSPNWRAQFDVDATRYSEDGAITGTSVTAHLFTEGPNWAVGGVLSNRDLLFASMWSLGLEGQTNLGQVVLEGEVGVGTIETFGGDTGTVNADGNATFYATPDFSIGLGVSYLDADDAFGSSLTYSIEGEYKFDCPMSVFAGWATADYDDVDVDVDTWRIGARWAFGNDTLQGRRETGPRWLRGLGNILPIA